MKSLKILSIRHSSSREGEERNVFVENKVVMTVTQYYKSYMLSNNVKIIHQYLPREVGELVVYYL